jgi:glycerol-3-phosphate dehydrogenase
VTRAPFSAASRAAALDALNTGTLDLLVIGGGITGAGVARDAALRGLRTALVERDDFASGTSSRSSRLIHGGLRYLEHGEFHLVFEASRERRTLMRIAPHLVTPLRFAWPVYRGARVPTWKLRAALMLYDALALFRNIEHHHMCSAAELEALEPALRRDGLVGGGTYYDAHADDALLTLANARAAADAGALVINHAAAKALLMENGAVRGAEIRCELTGRVLRAGAKCIVNATGPWSDLLRHLADPAAKTGIRGTKGAHIAVPRARVGNKDAIAITHPRDGRVMFILPAGAFTIVGTTDTDYDGPLDDVRASHEDVAYLLEAVNHYAPAAALGVNDVTAAWAGIRPLVASGASTTAAVSREHTIALTAPGMLTVTGGKLTTYRLMAAQIVDRAEKIIGAPHVRASTDRVPLVNDDRTGRYDGPGAIPLSPDLPYVWGQVRDAVTHGMALRIADVLVRRIPAAFETRDHGVSLAPAVARVMAPLLGWSAERERDELQRYARDAQRIFSVG